MKLCDICKKKFGYGENNCKHNNMDDSWLTNNFQIEHICNACYPILRADISELIDRRMNEGKAAHD